MMKLMSGRWKYQCHAVYPHRQYAKVVGSPVLSVSVSVFVVWGRSKLLTSFEVCPLARDTGTVNISFFCSSLSVYLPTVRCIVHAAGASETWGAVVGIWRRRLSGHTL